MALQILYIPGLGDGNPSGQIRALKRWNSRGVEVHFIPMNWSDDEPYESKLARVTKEIDKLATEANKVSLAGVSAGGSMAVNAYAARKQKISGVVFICGKLRNPEGVNESYFRKNPAFRKSVFSAGANVDKLTDADKAKMLTIRALYDGTIPADDSQIPGVKNKVLPVLFHVLAIILAITLRKKTAISFLIAQAE